MAGRHHFEFICMPSHPERFESFLILPPSSTQLTIFRFVMAFKIFCCWFLVFLFLDMIIWKRIASIAP